MDIIHFCGEPSEVDTIVFGDKHHDDDLVAYELERRGLQHVYSTEPSVGIGDGSFYVNIVGEQHARNLILALKKAIELGWFKHQNSGSISNSEDK